MNGCGFVGEGGVVGGGQPTLSCRSGVCVLGGGWDYLISAAYCNFFCVPIKQYCRYSLEFSLSGSSSEYLWLCFYAQIKKVLYCPPFYLELCS